MRSETCTKGPTQPTNEPAECTLAAVSVKMEYVGVGLFFRYREITMTEGRDSILEASPHGRELKAFFKCVLASSWKVTFTAFICLPVRSGKQTFSWEIRREPVKKPTKE